MAAVTETAVNWTEAGFLPDTVIRHGIRRLLRSRLSEIGAMSPDLSAHRESRFVEMMDASDIAPVPHLANEQHYEVPAGFFQAILGEHRKYSCGYWPAGVTSLSDAEAAGLDATCEHAGVEDGMRLLDLGCGWGAMTLYVASRYPNCQVTAVSNSRSQHDLIVAEAGRRGLTNVDVVVRDMNDFSTGQRFDRIVSVEMFEHMRNYRTLFRRIAGWLKPGGVFLMHIFCHRTTPYEFTDRGPGDWMSRYFFTGGIMPSDSLPLYFQDDLRLQRRWRWPGTHYAKTANAWLERMDAQKSRLLPILAATYGEGEAYKWWMRWRIFFMACAELFAFNQGTEWWVSHYRFVAPGDTGKKMMSRVTQRADANEATPGAGD